MELQEIEELALLLREHPISEISVERQGSRVHLRKGAATVSAAAPRVVEPTPSTANAVTPASTIGEPDNSVLLLSRMVGLFHHATPPVRVGSTIEEGQVVGNVESLKLMNEVVAEASGRVVEVFIEDGAPVEYGLRLFRVVPA